SYALLVKSGGLFPFLRARSTRLLLPLAFGLLVLVPPQSWVAMVGNHGYREGLGHFWLVDWLRFGPLLGVTLPRTEHLWFIAYLWTYTAALCLVLLAAPPAWRARAGALAAFLLARPRLLILPLAGLLLLRVVLLFTVPETKGVLHDWTSDLTYLPIFLFGFALAATPSLWPAILRLRRPAIAAAAVSLLVLVAVELGWPGERPHLAQAADRDASLLMAWSMVVLLLGVAHQWLRSDHRWRRPLSEAIFPVYLVHQTIIVLVGWRLRDSGLDALPAFLILAAATVAGGWAFYAIGRRIAWLRPFVGLSVAPRPSRRPFRPATDGA
ncbi:MAG: acyltransferase family protein, partial [Allosphingosinicella sp.]